MRCSHPTAVPQPEVNDHGNVRHWSSCDHPIYKTVVLFPQNAPLTCFLMFNDQTAATPAFRNELLSTEDWTWYGNVALIPLVGQ